jgi:hypothetical protein
MRSIDLVISYYKEDLDWLNNYKHITFRNIYIYAKGPTTPTIHFPHTVVKLENIGRESHTYLYHITKNYNDLADITVFTSGSSSIEYKKKKLKFIIDKSLETETSVFKGARSTNVRNDNYDFILDSYEATHVNNKEGDEAKIIKQSHIRPYGKWYEKNFPDIDIDLINYWGIFSVSKEHIHQHKKDYYMNLLYELPRHSHPEVGHYFERSWVAVFHPIPKRCLYYDDTIQEPFVDSIPKINIYLIVLVITILILAILVRYYKSLLKILKQVYV